MRASLNPNSSVSTYTYNADGTRHSKTVRTNVDKTTTYYYVEGVLYAVESPDYTVVFQFDDTGRPYGFRLLRNDSPGYESQLYYKYNLQGDVVGIYDATGNEVVTYTYDPWGKLLSATGVDVLIDANPLLYRGYVYDKETGFYYCNSRYYDPETGRFINADGELSDVGGDILGYNLFAYCFNNPVNMDDPTGNWPKWLSGALNVVGGALQVAAGAALGATVGWTGFGAVAAGFLIVNGTATAAQGVGQIVNHVTNSNVMREDNIVRTGVQEVGRAIGGDTGAKIAGGAYDVAVVAANLYAGKVGLQQAGKLPIKVNINNVVNNPLDEFVTIGPADGVIQQYCRTIPQSGYGKIYATQLGNGLYQIANGHHRVAALRALGYETIKIFLTK